MILLVVLLVAFWFWFKAN